MKGKNIITGIIILIVIVLVAWFAFHQGYIGGSADNQQDVQFNIPGGGSD